jgi:hypothetical protein
MAPIVRKYNGSGDPDNHINVFFSAGGVERELPPVRCHMFVQTLVCLARLWYESLPTVGIDSFEELVKRFMQQFSQQKRHINDRTEIIHTRRRDHESVEEFIICNKLESLQVGGASEDLMITGFILGVLDDELIRRLHGPEGMPL